MIEWPLLQVHVYSSYHFQQFIHWAQQPVLKACLEGKGLRSVSRIINKCLLESVTVTQVLKQFPIT